MSKDLSRLLRCTELVLPTSFGEGLSYYEVLCKVVKVLNELLERVEEIEGTTEIVTEISQKVKEIEGVIEELKKRTDVPLNINLSEFHETGVITETYADGEKTYVFDFDEEGRPIKITDSAGNETTLNWGG